MSGNITWEMVLGLVTLFAFIEGIRRYQSVFLTKVDKDLQDYKLHVSETYAAKSGVNAQFREVAQALHDMGQRVEKRLDGMNERLDRVIEARRNEHHSGSKSGDRT